MAALKPGASLENGAVVLEIEASDKTGRVYVLAVRTDLADNISLRGEQVFATWEFSDDGSRTQHGHYFELLSDARVDLCARAA